MEAPSNRESKGLTGIGCHLLSDYSISFDHILNINAGSESSSKRWWRKQQWRNLCSLGARARAKHCFHPISHSPPQQPCYSCATPTAVVGWEEQSRSGTRQSMLSFVKMRSGFLCQLMSILYVSLPSQNRTITSLFPSFLDFSKENTNYSCKHACFFCSRLL